MKIKLFTFFLFSSLLLAQQSQRDSDNDGVYDKFDKCPNTKAGVCVTKDGCIQKIKRVVHFDLNSFDIETINTKQLDDLIEIASECYGYHLVIDGHTDSISNKDYNKYLSKKRARSIEAYLLSKGIDENRITIDWFGESQPIATNVTKSGRLKNRRVEISFK